MFEETAVIAANMVMRKGIADGLPGVTREVFTSDGTGETIYFDFSVPEFSFTQVPMSKIANKAIDPYSITRVVALADGNIVEAGKESFTIQEVTETVDETGPQHIGYLVTTDFGGMFIPIVFITGQTYVFTSPNNKPSYISHIETETVHPIDQKYLPDLCTPKVIDLDELGFSEDILTMFMQGGGETEIAGTSAIFEELSGVAVGKTIIAKCSFAPINCEFRTSNTCYVCRLDSGRPMSFSFEVIVEYSGLHRVNVRFYNNSDGIALVVKSTVV